VTKAVKVGCHVSISGSISNAVDNAVGRECTAFQLFTRNPRGWAAKKLDEEAITDYKTRLEKSNIDSSAVCAHMPYLPNLASPKEDGFAKSVRTLRDEVERCGRLGIPYVVTHLGSHLGSGESAGIDRLVEGLSAGAAIDNNVMILLENTAGQKNSIGSELEQLATLLGRLEPSERFGVCFDTCHAFAAGYDLRTRDKVRAVFEEFDRHIGVGRLKVIHLNDAKGGIGSNLDRHYHIGLGEIGEEGLGETAKFAKEHDIMVILETPVDDVRDDMGNIRRVRELVREEYMQ